MNETTVRILLIEDSGDDEFLILKELERSTIKVKSTRVQTPQDLSQALINDSWDLIISDFHMPGFSGTHALEIYKDSGLDIPFIVFSGAVGEDVAVGMLKSGAHDFILKSQLKRLPLAVERELGEYQLRIQKRETEGKLKGLNRLYGILLEVNQLIVRSQDLDNLFKNVCQIFFSSGGFTRVLIAKRSEDQFKILAEEVDKFQSTLSRLGNETIMFFESLNSKRPVVSLPIGCASFPIGSERALILWSQNPEPFQGEELVLLEQLSEELSFAVEKKRAEESDEKSRALLGIVFDQSPNAMIFVSAEDQQVIMFNQAYKKIIGEMNQEVFRGKSWNELPRDWIDFDTDGNKISLNDHPLTIALEGQRVHQKEIRVLSTTGNSTWILVDAVPILDGRGKQLGAFMIATDITQFKSIEKALSVEKEKLFVTLKSITDGVVTTNNQGHVLLLNDGAAKALNRGIAEVMGEPIQTLDLFKNFLRPEDSDYQSWHRTLSTNEQPFVYTDAKGFQKRLEIGLSPLYDPFSEIQGAVWVIRDVTERENLESQIRRSDKLESLGLLAGGLAHDFNNLLTGIFGFIQLAKLNSLDSQKVESNLDNALNSFGRVKGLTQQLLTFSKGGELARSSVNLGPLVQKVSDFCLAGTNLVLDFQFPEDLKSCHVNENQIGQVFQNLLINAQQAMGLGGTLRVVAWNQDFLENNDKNLTPGSYVGVSFEDQGEGIKPENLKKIFDPFFTTKPSGNGLGLSICYSIIQKHGGVIDVSSQVGKGTCFTVFLPSINSEPLETTHVKVSSPVKGLRVLLMDDEDYARDVGASILATFGVETDKSSRGEETIEIFSERFNAGKPYDAVILDLTVRGGMGGIETLKHLRKIDSSLIAIASSGYSADTVIADPHGYGFQAALPKPYSIAEVGELLTRFFGKGEHT